MSDISVTDAIFHARQFVRFLESNRLSVCITHHSVLINVLNQTLLDLMLSEVSSDSESEPEPIERPRLTRQ
jgi:hypothetical protein